VHRDSLSILAADQPFAEAPAAINIQYAA
jgi:hypothetical protein